MGKFSDVLLTVDYDRTLTAPDSSIPERNLEAIRYFMENDGAFTVNTGRSVPMIRAFRDRVPVNAPLLLYNGSDAHYRFAENPAWDAFSDHNQCAHGLARPGDDLGPFLKFTLYGEFRDVTVASMFDGTPEEVRRMDDAEAQLKARFGAYCEVFRAATRIIDVHAKGVSKIRSARELQQRLGRKILVCMGDADNDISMLEGADWSFCPADGIVADRFPNVCPCADGAVADVIYEKIPEILRTNP